MPLADGSQISPRAAVTLLTGAEPKTPLMKRVMNKVAAFLLAPVPIANIPEQNSAGRRLQRLPQTSETGAHISGPKAKPSLAQSDTGLLCDTNRV